MGYFIFGRLCDLSASQFYFLRIKIISSISVMALLRILDATIFASIPAQKAYLPVLITS